MVKSHKLLKTGPIFGRFLTYSTKEDPRKFFFIKKFYLGVAFLMIHNQMSHTQPKNLVLSLIYRAAIDFKKSKKKKLKAPGPGTFWMWYFFFKEQKNYTKKTYQLNISFQLLFFTIIRVATRFLTLHGDIKAVTISLWVSSIKLTIFWERKLFRKEKRSNVSKSTQSTAFDRYYEYCKILVREK